MVSSFSTRKRLEKQNPGENSNTWGGYLNTNTIDMIDECFGLVCVAMTTNGDSTLDTANGATDSGRRSQIVLTGAPTSNVSLFAPAVQSFYLVRNKMTGSNKVTLKNSGGTVGVDFSGSGSGAEQGLVVSDGTNVREVLRTVSAGGAIGFVSAVVAAVSNVTLDTTGGFPEDLIPFHDASENGALNHVPVSSFYNNIVSRVPEETTVAVSDGILIHDLSASVGRVMNFGNLMKGVNLLTAETVPDINNDFVPMYDGSAATTDKVLLRYIRGSGVVSKAASYTTSVGDSHSTIRFSGLSADATLTLPAAVSCNGMQLTVINADRTYNVTVDGNASETIDTYATRRTAFSGPITIVCDGSGWYTKSGRWLYRSTGFTPSVNATGQEAHGLGTKPLNVWVMLSCNSADVGYTAGTVVPFNPSGNGDTGSYGIALQFSDTSLGYLVGDTGMDLINFSTGSIVEITETNWTARIYAEA
jgi:hypothetical protein